jgi:hypothetical protein
MSIAPSLAVTIPSCRDTFRMKVSPAAGAGVMKPLRSG